MDFPTNTHEDRARTAAAFVKALRAMADYWDDHQNDAEILSTYLADDLERFPRIVREQMLIDLNRVSDTERLRRASFGPGS